MKIIVRIAVAVAFLAAVLSPIFALPAEACSCASPGEIDEWIDTSEAVFVGTLVDQRDAGSSDDFGQESLYVFEVEEWVKGDLGDVIEVRSASDGGSCGFEFWESDMRTGAAISLDEGELHGNLCSQIDADVLLAAAAGPIPSSTGVAHLIAAHGWTSARLTVLDEAGHHVAVLNPPDDAPAWSGTQLLETCPGGNFMVQVAQPHVHIWDLSTLELVSTQEIPALEQNWPSDVDCREPDGSSIWILASGELDSELIEIVGTEPTSTTLPGVNGKLGRGFVVTQTQEGDAVWVDVDTGEATVLTETSADQTVGTSVAAHPTQPIVAVLENWYFEDRPAQATLTLFDDTGASIDSFEIPGEAYDLRWIDQERLSLYSRDPVDWERASGFVIDVGGGEMSGTPGWDALYATSEGDTIYGVDGGTIVTATVGSDSIDQLVTLPTQSAGPLVLLEDGPNIETTTTSTEPDTAATTPPLLAPDLDPSGSSNSSTTGVKWIAGGAFLVFLGILAWLAFHKPRHVD